MAIVMDKNDLPEVGDVVSRVEVAKDNVADVFFESGKKVPVHVFDPPWPKAKDIPMEEYVEKKDV